MFDKNYNNTSSLNCFDYEKYCVLDIETNGQKNPDIIEIAIQPLSSNPCDLPNPWSSLIKPNKNITQHATSIHRITNENVKYAPKCEELKYTIIDLLKNKCIIAHNAAYDLKVLRECIPEINQYEYIDTLRMAKYVWPNLYSYSLDYILLNKNIKSDIKYFTRHRAPYDANVTAKIFLLLLAEINYDINIYSNNQSKKSKNCSNNQFNLFGDI
ncbi:MAG: 3'-5' exonuclease [Chlorobiaceae bacterium]|nr:3'-5' exonuclease [Chlorobiaceae bacterium]